MPNDDLDNLFASAARQRIDPSEALLDRVIADALALQPRPLVLSPAPVLSPTISPRPGLLARLALAFGGGPALAGVCTAAVAGLMLGYFSPTTYDYLTSGLTGAEVIDLFPTTDFLSSEG